MRLLICAGGTGGGVYPALAVLQSLESEYESIPGEIEDATRVGIRVHPGLSVLWVGVEGGMEKDLMMRAGIPFETIPAAGVHGVGWRATPGNLLQLVRGYSRSRKILNRFHPDVLFFTGGYVAVPMALAGRGVPSLLYVPDIEPGLALKTLAYFADQLAVTVEASRAYLPHPRRLTVTGYPIRPEFDEWGLADARQVFNLNPDVPTLLVFGGSKGARSINQALITALPELLAEMQVIHITGQLDWERMDAERGRLSEKLAQKSWIERYHAFPYLHKPMGAALKSADLVLSRAGASILGEFPQFGLPAILVPYPHAWHYQKTNAQFLDDRGAAVQMLDEDLPERMATVVLELIRDHDRRERMRQAMRALARPAAAESISILLRRLAGEQNPGKVASR